MKLFIHVLGLEHRFVTACDKNARVKNVREALQTEHASLFPSTWPLQFHCLKDPKGFLISDGLKIGQAITEGGLVYAVHEHQMRKPEPPLSVAQALSSWNSWQGFLAEALHARQNDVLSQEGALFILCQLCSSANETASSVASKTLCSIVGQSAILPPDVLTTFLDDTRVLHSLVTATARAHKNNQTMLNCLVALCALVNSCSNDDDFLCLRDAGVESLLSVISEKNSHKRTKKVATLALLRLTRGHSGSDLESRNTQNQNENHQLVSAGSTTAAPVGTAPIQNAFAVGVRTSLSAIITSPHPTVQANRLAKLVMQAQDCAFMDFIRKPAHMLQLWQSMEIALNNASSSSAFSSHQIKDKRNGRESVSRDSSSTFLHVSESVWKLINKLFARSDSGIAVALSTTQSPRTAVTVIMLLISGPLSLEADGVKTLVALTEMLLLADQYYLDDSNARSNGTLRENHPVHELIRRCLDLVVEHAMYSSTWTRVVETVVLFLCKRHRKINLFAQHFRQLCVLVRGQLNHVYSSQRHEPGNRLSDTWRNEAKLMEDGEDAFHHSDTNCAFAQVLASACLKDENKAGILRAGGVSLLVEVLGGSEGDDGANVGVHARRSAARALVHLASSEDLLPDIAAAQTPLPSSRDVNDPVVRMYLEMLETAK